MKKPIFIFVCLAICSVQSSDIIRSTLLFSKNVEVDAIDKERVEYLLKFPFQQGELDTSGIKNITDIRHTLNTPHAVTVKTLEGGPGFDYASILIQSDFGYNINSLLTFNCIRGPDFPKSVDPSKPKPREVSLGSRRVKIPPIAGEIIYHTLAFRTEKDYFSYDFIKHDEYEKYPVKTTIMSGGAGFRETTILIQSERNQGIDSDFTFVNLTTL